MVYEIPDGDCRIGFTDTGVQLGKKVLPTESARFCFDKLAWPFGRAKVNSATPPARYPAIKADLVLMPAQLPHTALIKQVALLL